MDDGMAPMTLADLPQVAALWEEMGMWPHEGEDAEWLRGALARNPGCALVWREGGRVVGTVLGAWDGVRGWIYRLAVAEPRRGRGLGGRLLAAAEARLRELGARQINLMVYEDNGRAWDYYARRGYEPSPVKVMRKRLGAGGAPAGAAGNGAEAGRDSPGK